MYKYLPKISVLLIAVALSPFYLLPATAETRCLNYWVNPATGKEECLNLPVTKKPVVEAVKPADTPAGFEFLTESEKGEHLFIQVNNTRRVDGILQSFPTVVTKKLNGKMYDTRYQVNCTQRLVYISSSSDYILNNSLPIVVSQPGTIGYMIWDRSCTNIPFPTSTANVQKFRLVPSRCGEYRVKIVDQDYVNPRRLNPYWLGRGGNLSTLKPKISGLNPVFSNRQLFKPNNHQKNYNSNPVQPQIESNFQENYQTSGGYQWRSCQRDYRH
ncbi:hypothetical protein H6G06_24705 [Anabaena sphaerica FACHB-251]|uniref:Chromophore lyase CpcT/CpeT n=1 Tax=Anabaena sphaerica FACHB-251 TaxID=2692883 RepID=A0A926WNW3_9NOST|nr:hypothetical protein [Anabaena sphaerica]MBD2296593.1 hypothetical protein [Anabaena sphaerica FACHB-251]